MRTLIGVCNKLSSTFSCKRFGARSVLRVDHSIDCNGPNRSLWLAFAAVFFVVYAFGVPLVYARLLYEQRKPVTQPAYRFPQNAPYMVNFVALQDQFANAAHHGLCFLAGSSVPRRRVRRIHWDTT